MPKGKRGSAADVGAVEEQRPRRKQKGPDSYVEVDSDVDMDVERDVIGANMAAVKLDATALAKFSLTGLAGHLATKEASISKQGDVDASLTTVFENILCRGLEAQSIVTAASMEESDDDDRDSDEEASAAKRIVNLYETRSSWRKWWGTPKERIGMVFDLAGRDHEQVKKMPVTGWDKNEKVFDPTETNGPYRRAKAILNGVIDIAASWICPTDPASFLKVFFSESTVIGGSKLLKNTIGLFVCGHRSVAAVAGALLAKSITRDPLSKALGAVDAATVLLRSRTVMGKQKFASLRRTHDEHLVEGKPVPARIYPWRVKMEALINAISFLEQFLQIVPGDTRTVTLAGSIFKNLPVYCRGGQSLKDIWVHYKAVMDEDGIVGEKTFYELRLLSTKGKMKDSLSTFYIALRHLDHTFDEMMDRLGSIDLLKDMAGVEEFRKDPTKQQTVADDCKELKRRWKELSTFLSFEYGRDHPEKESSVACHCARHALSNDSRQGSRCSDCAMHEHGDFICKQCAEMFLFFDSSTSVGPVATLVDHVRSNIPGANPRNEEHVADGDVVKELKSMAAVLEDMQQQVKLYAAHRTRWRVQKDKFGQILEGLDDDGTVAVLVLDHKQKVVDASYREAQVDYFGKRGKSFCGINLIRRVKKGGKVGFELVFFDFVVEGYDEQNHIQVCTIISKALKLIKEEFPEIKEIIAKADNASCMGSTNSIPYLYHLNKELREEYADHRFGPIQLTRWFSMESQTNKCHLDCHFSYVNVNFRGYVESGNNMLTHTDVWRALKHNDGIAGSYAILLDTRELAREQRSLLQDGKKYETKTGSRSIHDIIYFTDRVEVYRYSDITVAEVITDEELQKYPKCNLPVTVKDKDPSDGPGKYFWKSPKEARFVPDVEAPADETPTDGAGAAATGAAVTTENAKTKAQKLTLALEGAGIDFGANVDHSVTRGLDLVPSGGENSEKAAALAKLLPPGWAEKNFRRDECRMSADTLQEIHKFEMEGRRVKKLKVTFNRIHEVIRPKMNDWREIFFSSPQRIKAITNWKPRTREEAIKKAREADATGNPPAIELTEVELETAGQEVVEEVEAEEVEDAAVRAEPVVAEDAIAEDLDATGNSEQENEDDELAATQLRNERLNRVEVPVGRRSGRSGRGTRLPERFRE